MKKQSIALALLVGVAAASLAGAADTPKETKATKPATKCKCDKLKTAKVRSRGENREAMATGSYLPQTVRRNGQITDGMSQVLVVDQDTIRTSGANDIRQLLTRQGIH